MDSSVLQGLNRAQREAVVSSADVLQVLAPPGSGKTKTITARVAYLLAHKRLKPWNIIVCTFTVKAATEMKQRITGFVGEDCARQLKLGTFHSIAVRYLRRYGEYIGISKNFGIADTSDSKAILKRIIKQGDFSIDVGLARSRISAQKAQGIDSTRFAQTAKKAEQQEFTSIYQQYDAALAASNLLDYDDLLLRCCCLLRKHPDCVSNIQALLIDEFQDTNNIQYELMGLFAQALNIITIVGDPDQSIYGFRSAEIKNLARMRHQWPDTLTINLEENYRSSGAILLAAQQIIEQDEARPPKRLQATHGLGLRPVLRKLPSAAAEASWLVTEVKRLQALTGNLLQAGDVAVLLRTAALSRPIETALGKEGIAYRMIGGTRFYDRIEVKVLIDYLRAVATPNNNEVVERIINVPARRVGDATIEALHLEARQKHISLWKFVLGIVRGEHKSAKNIPAQTASGLSSFADVILTCQTKFEGEPNNVVELLQYLLKKLSYQDWLKKKYPDDHEGRWVNVEELIVQAKEVVVQSPLLDEGEEVVENALTAFLANIALSSATEQKAETEGQHIQQVTISTIHAAKGLEWPVVFIPACYDGSIPHSRAEDHDEERRLLYVGMTRAQAVLYLSAPLKDSQRTEKSISPFLAQPGVSSFFEEHGPSLAHTHVRSLATTLKRTAPSIRDTTEAAKLLEREEDDYWPLNGEEPVTEQVKWDCGMQTERTARYGGFGVESGLDASAEDADSGQAVARPGFVSCKDRYQEALEEARLRKMDKLAEQTRAAGAEKPKGRKRQIEGERTIADFFGKSQTSIKGSGRNIRTATEMQRESQDDQRSETLSRAQRLPYIDFPRTSAETQREGASSGRNCMLPTEIKPQASQKRLRTEPISGKPKKNYEDAVMSNAGYVFLSSSPPKDQHAESLAIQAKQSNEPKPLDAGVTSSMRPATTLHTTTMQQIKGQRRTLGVRRSLHGWSARGGRGR